MINIIYKETNNLFKPLEINNCEKQNDFGKEKINTLFNLTGIFKYEYAKTLPLTIIPKQYIHLKKINQFFLSPKHVVIHGYDLDNYKLHNGIMSIQDAIYKSLNEPNIGGFIVRKVKMVIF